MSTSSSFSLCSAFSLSLYVYTCACVVTRSYVRVSLRTDRSASDGFGDAFDCRRGVDSREENEEDWSVLI